MNQINCWNCFVFAFNNYKCRMNIKEDIKIEVDNTIKGNAVWGHYGKDLCIWVNLKVLSKNKDEVDILHCVVHELCHILNRKNVEKESKEEKEYQAEILTLKWLKKINYNFYRIWIDRERNYLLRFDSYIDWPDHRKAFLRIKEYQSG